ncbi:hypothetical protein Tco_0553767 [Tanacetum coccineum]
MNKVITYYPYNMPNNSQVKFKGSEVEDHHRISSNSKKTKFVTACNDSLNSRISNVNVVCADCGQCVFNSNHDACVSRYLNDVNARTKKPNVVPISASKPKIKVNRSVVTPHKKTVASDTTIQKSKSYYKELFLGTVHFGNDQFALIHGYGDLIQGNVTIKRVYYVQGLNQNLFSVGQFCDTDLEVAFWKSTCYVRDLQGNDLLTGGGCGQVRRNSIPLISSLKEKNCFWVKMQLGQYPTWVSTWLMLSMCGRLESKVMMECCFVVKRDAWLREFSFILQMGFTLILATLDGLDVGLLGDVIGEDDCDDDG